MSRINLCIRDSFFLLLALLLLMDAEMFLLAAAAHEAGHYLAVRLCGGRLLSLELGAAGVLMRYRAAGDPARRLCIAAAGPAASLLCAWLAARAQCYAFAGANVLLGLFNLLPAAPLDGWTVLQCALSPCGAAGERLSRGISWLSALALTAGGALLCARGYGAAMLGMGIFIILQQKNLHKTPERNTIKKYSGKTA